MSATIVTVWLLLQYPAAGYASPAVPIAQLPTQEDCTRLRDSIAHEARERDPDRTGRRWPTTPVPWHLQCFEARIVR